jgi:hypothetical protein
MVYLDMNRKVSGQHSKPQGPKTSVGGRGNDSSEPITVSTTLSSLSHFSRAYFFHQSEYGRLAEISNSQQGHGERQSHDRGAPKSELQNVARM